MDVSFLTYVDTAREHGYSVYRV